MKLAGQVFDHPSPREALAGGIGMVFQERLAFPNLSVAANIFAGREITRTGERLDHAAMRTRTGELLNMLRVPIGPDDPMEHLFNTSAGHTAGSGRHDDTSVVVLERT